MAEILMCVMRRRMSLRSLSFLFTIAWISVLDVSCAGQHPGVMRQKSVLGLGEVEEVESSSSASTPKKKKVAVGTPRRAGDIYKPPPNITENKQRIYLRRMRKAGSTTVSEYIREATFSFAKAIEKPVDQVIIYDRMEYSALNIKCIFGPNPILMIPNTVLITHFRNPISRINSEYWFKGPGDILGSSNVTLWENWIKDTPNRLTSSGVSYNAGIYFDNYYTRLLSNTCTEQCDLGFGGKIHAKDMGGAVKGCAASYTARPYQTFYQLEAMNKLEEMLETSQKVLSKFHILLIMEYFEKPALNIWFRYRLEELLHAPRGTFHKLGLGHKRDNFKVKGNDKDSEVVTDKGELISKEVSSLDPAEEIPPYRSIPPPKIVELLKKENVYDIRLYQWAKTKVDAWIVPYQNMTMSVG